MNCLEREKMLAFVHRILGPREEVEVRAHLAVCGACRAAAEEYRKLDTLLEEWKPIEPSPSFDARVRSAIESSLAEARSGFFGFLGFRWLAPALAAVLVVVASVVVHRGRQPGSLPRRDTGQVQTNVAPTATPAVEIPMTAEAAGEEELALYRNLSVLEDYDLLANFDVLSELPKGGEKVAN